MERNNTTLRRPARGRYARTGRSTRRPAPRRTGDAEAAEKKQNFPSPKKDEIRLLVFGGVSEVGKNMYAIEYNDTIVLLECGTSFGETSTPGVGVVMPGIEYLKERRRSIKAVVVTDASLSHIGALPYMLSDIGNPTVYTRALTKDIIRNWMRDIRKVRTMNCTAVEKPESVTVGSVTLHFFGLSDTTPTALGVLIETETGCVSYTGNLQLERKKGVISASEEEKFSVHKGRNVLMCIAASVNAEQTGLSMNDDDVVKNITEVLEEAPYRAIIPLIPSQVKRNCMVVEAALKLGKKIYVQGPNLMGNLRIAEEHGLLNIPEGTLIPIADLKKRGDDAGKTLIICSSTENEEYEMLEKMSRNDYAHASIIPDDTVIFPSPIVPTNARTTQNLKDGLSRSGAIIHSYDTSDVKGSMYANKEELQWMHRHIREKYFVPVQGYHYMLTAHTHIAEDSGIPLSSFVIPENGSVIDIGAGGNTIRRHRKRVRTGIISVDGHLPYPIHDTVLQDRKTLAQEGILVIIIFVDQRKLLLKKSPDILSRGFIYLKESRDLIARTRVIIKNASEKNMKEEKHVNIETLKKAVQKELKSFLMNETNKKPVIIPVIFL